MRPVQIYDLTTVARVLLALPEGQRRFVSRRIVMAADVADRFRKRTGRAHPDFGTGTLQSASRGYSQAAEPASCGTAFRACLCVVLETLAAHDLYHRR